MTPRSVLPEGHLVPPPMAVVGTVTLRLRMGGTFEMESDVQDARILIEMLRKTADAIERAQETGPGRVLIDGRRADLVHADGPPGRV